MTTSRPGPTGPEHHGPEQHGPERHGPEQHGPEHHGPEQHNADRRNAEHRDPGQPDPGHADPGHQGPVDRTDVGAYVLGLLEPADRAAFEEHLAGCPQCAEQVRELGFMEPLLAEYAASAEAAGLDPAAPPPEPDGALLDRLVAEVAARRRRGRIRRLVLVGAAAAMLVAGPAITAAVVTDSAPGVVAVAQQFSATDPASGARAVVGVDGKPWGTQVSLELSNVRGPLSCDLVAVSHTGERQTVTTWSVPAAGYGPSGTGPATLHTSGGTGLRPGDIDHFEVRTLDGATVLVSVPARTV
ncbi:zf-HC2 domain-containing protein [Kitasatospora sp. NBC_01560]|uniref:anti-sigma factor n=1 Tax=Kitasatospora sp. NBC_01560 TaxID=2975965 RepID=UPI00386636D4